MKRSDAAAPRCGERDRAIVFAAIDQHLRAGEVRRRVRLRLRARLERGEDLAHRRVGLVWYDCSLASSARISGRGGAGSTLSAAAIPSAIRSASCADARAGSAATAAFSSAIARSRTPARRASRGRRSPAASP